MKLWIIFRKKHKIARDYILESDGNDAQWKEALGRFLSENDYARPVFLSKHDHEMAQFFRTVFSKNDFIEPFDFDAMEVEFVRDKKKEDER